MYKNEWLSRRHTLPIMTLRLAELLVRTLAATLAFKASGLCWGHPPLLHLCCHPGAEESYEQSAEREIQEEMGVSQVELKTCFDFYHADETSKLWGRLFTCTYDGDFKLDPEEVESGNFMSVQVMALCLFLGYYHCCHPLGSKQSKPFLRC